MNLIIKRGDKYLSNRYNWQPVPDLFPEWHLDAILNCMGAVQVARVGKGVIDLDTLEFTRIEI